MTIEINGVAHVILTVSRFEVAREFYRKLLPEFGMKPVFDGDEGAQEIHEDRQDSRPEADRHDGDQRAVLGRAAATPD